MLGLGLELGLRLGLVMECGEAYIGETVRRLETRVKEHRSACQKGVLEKSALAEHTWMNHHPIQWEQVSVIDRARTAKE